MKLRFSMLFTFSEVMILIFRINKTLSDQNLKKCPFNIYSLFFHFFDFLYDLTYYLLPLKVLRTRGKAYYIRQCHTILAFTNNLMQCLRFIIVVALKYKKCPPRNQTNNEYLLYVKSDTYVEMKLIGTQYFIQIQQNRQLARKAEEKRMKKVLVTLAFFLDGGTYQRYFW